MFDLQEIVALSIVAAVAGRVAWCRWLAPMLHPVSQKGGPVGHDSGGCSGCAFAKAHGHAEGQTRGRTKGQK